MKNEILEMFLSMAKSSINEKGIYPHIVIMEKDGHYDVAAIPMDPDDMYNTVKKMFDEKKPNQIILGIDRTSLPNQGIDDKYHSVLTIAYYAIGKWSIGAMPYASHDDVGEVQWNNDWWNTAVRKELVSYSFLEPTQADEVIGHAYQNKIMLTVARKTQMGTFYEGVVNFDNLSDDVKEYLTEKSLDVNDRKSVEDHFKSIGKEFTYIKEGFGFWSLKVGHGIFPARTSKTKLYIEGVEAMVNEVQEVVK